MAQRRESCSEFFLVVVEQSRIGNDYERFTEAKDVENGARPLNANYVQFSGINPVCWNCQVPAWLMTRSALSYSSCREGLNLHISMSILWPVFQSHPSLVCVSGSVSNSEFPHCAMTLEYPFERKAFSTVSERTACTRGSKRVEPTVTKTSFCVLGGDSVEPGPETDSDAGDGLRDMASSMLFLTFSAV